MFVSLLYAVFKDLVKKNQDPLIYTVSGGSVIRAGIPEENLQYNFLDPQPETQFLDDFPKATKVTFLQAV